MNQALFALSPLDGRYASKIAPLRDFFSEAALIQARTQVELFYLLTLAKAKIIPAFNSKQKQALNQLLQPLTVKDFEAVKKFETQTHHDVKAIEYFLQTKFKKLGLSHYQQFIHFGLTSADINNLAYRLLLTQSLNQVIWPQLLTVMTNLISFASDQASTVILARTHGQPALPTTFGKEISVFIERLLKPLVALENWQADGKFGGAVGSFQALQLVLPATNWPQFAQQFVNNLGFNYLPNTTQINANDDLISLFSHLEHFNLILINLDQDLWRYISDDWLCQPQKKDEVGSSTMPQKINPIEFENSEGNLTLANGIFHTLSTKLAISRLQRDLSGSTLTRNLGVGLGHSLLAYQSFNQGFTSLAVNHQSIEQALNSNWSILTEAWQTLARFQGQTDAYEQVAQASRGQKIDQPAWKKLTQDIDSNLANLTPSKYIGLAPTITRSTVNKTSKIINHWQTQLAKKQKFYESLPARLSASL